MSVLQNGTLAVALGLAGLWQTAQSQAQTTSQSLADQACITGATGCVRAPLQMPGGQVAIINPETGELVQEKSANELSDATRVEIESFNRQLLEQSKGQFSVEGLEERRTQSGAVGVDLGDRFLVPYVVHIAPDGTQHFGHGAITLD